MRGLRKSRTTLAWETYAVRWTMRGHKMCHRRAGTKRRIKDCWRLSCLGTRDHRRKWARRRDRRSSDRFKINSRWEMSGSESRSCRASGLQACSWREFSRSTILTFKAIQRTLSRVKCEQMWWSHCTRASWRRGRALQPNSLMPAQRKTKRLSRSFKGSEKWC